MFNRDISVDKTLSMSRS